MKNFYYKKNIATLIIGIILALLSLVAGWLMIFITKGDGQLNALGILIFGLLALVPISSIILIITSSSLISYKVLKNHEHPIRNTFILQIISGLLIVFGVLLLSIVLNLLPNKEGIFIFFIVICSMELISMTTIYLIGLTKFIIEIIREYILIRTAIIETREILTDLNKKDKTIYK